MVLAFVILQVLYQLMNNAAKAPQVRREVVLLLDERYLRRPVPPRADMKRHVSLHGLPPLSIRDQLLSNVHPLLFFVAFALFVGVLPQIKRVLKRLIAY